MSRKKGTKPLKVSLHILLEPELKAELEQYAELNKVNVTDVVTIGIKQVIQIKNYYQKG